MFFWAMVVSLFLLLDGHYIAAAVILAIAAMVF